MNKQRLWTNGKFITLDDKKHIGSEMLTQDDRIVAVGDNIRGQLGSGEGTEVIDLGGQVVVPGFIDSHIHFTMTALGLVDADLKDIRSLAELLDVMRERVAVTPEGCFCRGWIWDETHYPEGRAPTRWDLDAIAPNTPVVLVRIGENACVANSKALGLLNVPETMSGVVRSEDGQINGLLKGDANFFALQMMHGFLTPEERVTAYDAMAHFAASRGTTTVHAIEGSMYKMLKGERSYPNSDVDYLLSNPPDIPLDIVIWDTQTIHYDDLQRVKKLGLPRIGGDIFVDGVLGVAWMPGVARAAISEPYLDGDRGLGDLQLSDQVLTDFMVGALELELQVSCHTVGDRAIGQFIRCYENALKRCPRPGLRPRVEHAILATDEQIKRSAELGIIFSTQPAFEWQSGGAKGRYAQRLGEKRVRRTHPIRPLLDAGVVVAGGSDSPANASDALLGVHACVYHETEESRVTPWQALQIFSTNAAWSGFEETRKGTLEAGKQADFAVLAEDPTKPGISIKDIRVVRTVQRGRDSYLMPKA